MGNIKHNDELLRVHDDGFDVVFNCDNKHQNGVSYHAEKNGKKTKIDPEYAMATLVKKISGGGWPEDMPVPSAGGYGYTEQESRVAFEGSIDISDGDEFDVESSEPVLEVGKTYTVVIDDAEYANLTAAADEWGGVMVGDRSYADYPFSIAAYPYEIYIDMDPSIYARGPIYNIKIESTEETIHMINSKYLPASGGAMVIVPISMNMETYQYELTDDSIPVLDTIKSDFDNGKLYPIVLFMSTDIAIGVSGCMTITNIVSTPEEFSMNAYMSAQGASGFETVIFRIANVGDGWAINQINIL